MVARRLHDSASSILLSETEIKRFLPFIASLWIVIGGLFQTDLGADQPADTLHSSINQLLGNRPDAASLAADDTFVRRVYLDLLGAVPTRDEYLAFLMMHLPTSDHN